MKRDVSGMKFVRRIGEESKKSIVRRIFEIRVKKKTENVPQVCRFDWKNDGKEHVDETWSIDCVGKWIETRDGNWTFAETEEENSISRGKFHKLII